MTRKRIQAAIHHESGQSLVVVVLALIVIMGVSALAIDVSGWFVTRHHAQVAADAAALAAANYMATSSGQGSVTTATGYARQYVADNGFNGNNATVTVNTSAATVTVTVPTTGSIFFARALGFGPPNISATAVASYETGSSPYALFAGGTCTTGGGTGIDLNLNGNTTLDGVHSNGDLSGQIGNNTSVNLNTLSMYSKCSSSLQNGNNAKSPTVTPAPTGVLSYPVNYASPTCTINNVNCYFPVAPAATPQCTYTAGVGQSIPSGLAITSSGNNITVTGSIGSSTTPVILCAPNGTITVATNNTTYYGTLYAQTVDLNGEGITLYPPPDQLGIYETGTTTVQLNPGQGNGKGSNNDVLENAYIFAPNATVDLGGNNGSGFIEANSINVSGNNWQFVGTGPSDPYVFADTLVQ
ncbi:pilus assembly protein TadG-related protein [Conexibacter sp. S30A1]|uniref:pilus assembly protein TadG-related protein n=1 Tax=Conexibacter sp. S30A1 TaxID=2937800 RepID=UPI00200C4623|nr:pilus assembly protein TadG-related protein [Conexibacter sp. S30A1]